MNEQKDKRIKNEQRKWLNKGTNEQMNKQLIKEMNE